MTLLPVHTQAGALDLERTTVKHTCPGCKRARITRAASTRFYCDCGEVVPIAIPDAEWKRITEEHARIDTYAFISKSMASTWWRR